MWVRSAHINHTARIISLCPLQLSITYQAIEKRGNCTVKAMKKWPSFSPPCRTLWPRSGTIRTCRPACNALKRSMTSLEVLTWLWLLEAAVHSHDNSVFLQLLFEAEFCRVEKIKVISSTYMAACGLQPGRKNSLEPSSSSLLPSSVSANVAAAGGCTTEDSTSSRSSSVQEPFSKGDNAAVMAKFAAAMMRTIKSSKQKAQAFFQMRIGK